MPVAQYQLGTMLVYIYCCFTQVSEPYVRANFLGLAPQFYVLEQDIHGQLYFNFGNECIYLNRCVWL